MTEKIRILFLSANPWTTSRILVDEEAREIFEKLQEGSHRDKFELIKHEAIRAIDLQRLLMMHEPHIVHFSGHGSKKQKLILGGTSGRGKEVDRRGLVDVFGLYKHHVRLVLLNACFTKIQARDLSEVIDYSVGTGKGMGDKGGVAFAGGFYRALGFGKSVKEAFESAKAELGLTKIPRTSGIELFARNGISENDPFPQACTDLSSGRAYPWKPLSDPFVRQSDGYEISHRGSALLHEALVLERGESSRIPVIGPSSISSSGKLIRYEEEGYSCELNRRQISFMRGETSAPTRNLMERGGKRSPAALSSLRRAKRANSANLNRSKDEIEQESATGHLRDYLSVTIKVQRVVLISAIPVSQTEIGREHKTPRTRWGSKNQKLGRDE